MPDANELTVHIMAAFAEHEVKQIGERTKDALAAAKACGVRLGVSGAANLKRNIAERQEVADAFAAWLAGACGRVPRTGILSARYGRGT